MQPKKDPNEKIKHKPRPRTLEVDAVSIKRCFEIEDEDVLLDPAVGRVEVPAGREPYHVLFDGGQADFVSSAARAEKQTK